MNFCQLHCHSYFSILDGVASPEELVEKAASVGMKALALTDHGNMSAIFRFSQACKKFNVKPIIGCEFYVNNDRDLLKESGPNCHLVLLAKNKKGYKNLLKINYESCDKGFYYRGRTTEDFIFSHSEGLVCTTACMGSSLAKKILANDLTGAEELFLLYKEVFKEDFYGEIHLNEMEEQKKVSKYIYKLCKKHRVKFIIAGDCHYIEKEDAEIQDRLIMISRKKRESDENIFRFSARCLYFHSSEDYFDFNTRFGYNFPVAVIREGLETTLEVADKCNFNIEIGKNKFPKYIDEDGNEVNADFLLEKKCRENIHKIIPKGKSNIYMARLEKELTVVIAKGFSNYFLIIEDLINFCKKVNIGIGAGRGSAAGSLISYILGITRIDPVRFGLLFERFLNSQREDPPDIDLDFESKRKNEIEEYLKGKYGRNKVAHILTFSTFGTKGALRDVARTMNKEKDDEFVSIIKKMEDDSTKQYGIMEQLYSKEWTKKEKNYIDINANMFNTANKIVGKIRQIGRHAAGIAITPGPVYSYIPVQKIKGEIVTGFTEGKDYRELSAVGVLKIDVLGLDQVDILKASVENAKKFEGKKIDLDNINLEDPLLFNALNKFPNIGIFQFENHGIDAYLKNVKPFCFHDIVTTNALYRPAILNAGEHDEYLRKRKKIIEEGKKYKGLTKEMGEILSSTHGTIVFQEQFIEILHKIGNFTLEEADKARKTFKLIYLRNMSTENKKEDPELLKVISKFKEGALKKGFPENKINPFIDKLAEFAQYSFNLSHSVSYSVISMQSLYLREYYPLCFYPALLNTTDNVEKAYGFRKENKMKKYFSYIMSRDIEFAPIDINNSGVEFAPTKEGKISIPFTFIKGLGESLGNCIMDASPFSSFSDFVLKEMNFKTNKTAVLSLIAVGAFDKLNKNKRAMYEFYLEWAPKRSRYKNKSREQILAAMKKIWSCHKDCDEFSWQESKELEEKACNFNVFYGTSASEKRKIEFLQNRGKIIPLLDNIKGDERYCFIITAIKTIKDKNGKQMAFLSVEDWLRNTIEVAVFQDVYRTEGKQLEKGVQYLMSGYKNRGMIIAGSGGYDRNTTKVFIRLDSLKNI